MVAGLAGPGQAIRRRCRYLAPARLRPLERGDAELEYLEGIRLAKTLDLCPNCFRRLLEAAAVREEQARAGAAASIDLPTS